MALAAERSTARHLDDIAAFWAEFICEEEPRKTSTPEFKANKICCQDPIYQDMAEISYQSENSMTKQNSFDFAIPDHPLLLEDPPLKSNKSMMSSTESSEQHQELQRDIRVGLGTKKTGEKLEKHEGGKVVINARPPVVVAAPLAEKM